jgi:hypothetical protein
MKGECQLMKRMMITRWMLAALMMSAPMIAHAQAEDPPLMDDPPLPWFTYTHDEDGGITFLSKNCLADVKAHPDLGVHDCAVREARQHQALIERHDARLRPGSRPGAGSAATEGERLVAEAHLGSLETQIGQAKAHMIYVQSMMARQHRVAVNTGYSNKTALFDGDMMLAEDQDQINQIYAQYRAEGGRKLLEDIVLPDAEASAARVRSWRP